MSRTPVMEMRRLEAVEHPGALTVIAKGREFMCRRAITSKHFAGLLGVGRSTLDLYLEHQYEGVSGRKSSLYMDAKVWSYIMRHWPRDPEGPSEQLLETRAFRKIRECIEEAVAVGANSLIYGPPSSEKSFVAEQIVAQYRAAGRRDLIRIMASPGYSPSAALRDIAREAEVWVRSEYYRNHRDALVDDFLSRERPPAIIVDEAQHLSVETIECLRIDVRERTKRGSHMGAGLILMGSHNLYHWLTSPARRFHLEQWLSRNSYRVQLEGMAEDEVLQIGARALGQDGRRAKLSDMQKKWLLDSCRVVDPYAADQSGKPLRDVGGKPAVRTYYSSRRLLEAIRQRKTKAVSLILAEEVA